MAERRMFAKKIIDSDIFLGMPLSTQSLYFHLGMRADDDGFIDNPKSIQRTIGASDDDLKLLMAKRFIIPFESGIVVIRHWKIHNYIQKDRYKETQYLEEKSMLESPPNKPYELLDTYCIQPVSNSCPQVRLGKGRIVEVSEGEGREEMGSGEGNFVPIPDFPPEEPIRKPARSRDKRFVKPTFDDVVAYITEKGLNVDPAMFFDHYEANGWKAGRTAMKDWKATLRNWSRREDQFKRTGSPRNGSRDILGDMIRDGAFSDD